MSQKSHRFRGVIWSGIVLLLFFLLLVLAMRHEEPELPLIHRVSDFQLTNQVNQLVTLKTLHGHPWLANVIFTRCPGFCPLMTRRMADLAKRLPAGAGVQLVSLTTDPEFDRPEVLKQFSEKYEADPQRWSFLTGRKGEVQRVVQHDLLLAAKENESGARESENDLFTHSSLIVLVDKNGWVRGSYESLKPAELDRLLVDLERL